MQCQSKSHIVKPVLLHDDDDDDNNADDVIFNGCWVFPTVPYASVRNSYNPMNILLHIHNEFKLILRNLR